MCSFQDLGRYGYEDIGITNSGASDEISYLIANSLLGNPSNCSTLEITLGNLKLRALNSATVAISGADMGAMLNGKPLKNNYRFSVKKGDVLDFNYAKKGQIAYLAIRGGFDSKKVLNSYSVCLRDEIMDNIKSGDILKAKKSSLLKKASFISRFQTILDFDKTVTLTYLPTYQNSDFDSHLFESHTFQISNRYNKMGYKLSPLPLWQKKPRVLYLNRLLTERYR